MVTGHTDKCVSVTAYSYRLATELGRLVLNMFTPIRMYTLAFANSSLRDVKVHVLCREREFSFCAVNSALVTTTDRQAVGG